MAKKKDTLTTASGSPVADNQNSLTAGPRGPLLVQDWQLFDERHEAGAARYPGAAGTALLQSRFGVRQGRSQWVEVAGDQGSVAGHRLHNRNAA